MHSIFTDLNTDKWKLVRKAVSPAFSSANIRYCSCLAAKLIASRFAMNADATTAARIAKVWPPKKMVWMCAFQRCPIRLSHMCLLRICLQLGTG